MKVKNGYKLVFEKDEKDLINKVFTLLRNANKELMRNHIGNYKYPLELISDVYNNSEFKSDGVWIQDLYIGFDKDEVEEC